MEYGLKNASFNRIIERSGLSKGSVYYYFNNKDSLLNMVMEHIGRLILEAIPFDAVPESAEEYWDMLHSVHRQVCDFFSGNPKLGQIMFMALADRVLSDDDKLPGGAFSVILRRHAAMIRRGQEIGAVRSDIGVGMIVALMQAVDRTLFFKIFDCGPDRMKNMSDDERSVLVEHYLTLAKDMFKRILCVAPR